MARPEPARKASTEPVIEVRGLTARYGRKVVLQDVSFEVPAETTLVVLGPSGCGKSTLLRCLVGLLPPAAGEVRVLGEDIARMPPEQLDLLRRKVGVAFQSAALLGSLTVGENVSLPLREHTGLDAATVRIMTRMKLDAVGLAGSEDLMPAQLSGGMKKRAGVARAISMDPRCLFLDEPSAGLDPITAAGLDDMLSRLRKVMRLTMMVVTHELESAFTLGDSMLMLDKGTVRIHGSADEVRASKDPRVRQFFDRQPDPETGGERLVTELVRE